jgi:hypothetical protein
MPTTPTNQTQIDFLIDLIGQGKSHGECLAQFGTKWNKSKNTFERRWNIANEQYRVAQISIKNAKRDLDIQNELSRKKGLILEREEVLKFSSDVLKIAYNNVIKNKDEKSIQSFATAQTGYSKLVGYDAPTKNANVKTNGEDIEDPLAQLIKQGGKIRINGK